MINAIGVGLFGLAVACLFGVVVGLLAALAVCYRLPPCDECGRGLWRWRSMIVMNGDRRQVLFRPFRWAWRDVLAKTSKLSGHRKLYSRWVLRGPLEIRVWRARK